MYTCIYIQRFSVYYYICVDDALDAKIVNIFGADGRRCDASWVPVCVYAESIRCGRSWEIMRVRAKEEQVCGTSKLRHPGVIVCSTYMPSGLSDMMHAVVGCLNRYVVGVCVYSLRAHGHAGAVFKGGPGRNTERIFVGH